MCHEFSYTQLTRQSHLLFLRLLYRRMKIKRNDEYVVFLENKLDTDIGYFYWKKYIASAFWAQISMPINLIITLMTAITTAGQANSPNLLPKEVYVKISIVTLLITVLNTFFRPHEQMTNNIDIVLYFLPLFFLIELIL